ncbi:hypothetical protein AADZ90_007290 [Aestuariibius sp. 2305UL40-4]|uniref:hypothetical protein n=1 Tax=Aestuariibius violaceus TaxID=3234132 RepID=UPI00345EC274
MMLATAAISEGRFNMLELEGAGAENPAVAARQPKREVFLASAAVLAPPAPPPTAPAPMAPIGVGATRDLSPLGPSKDVLQDMIKHALFSRLFDVGAHVGQALKNMSDPTRISAPFFGVQDAVRAVGDLKTEWGKARMSWSEPEKNELAGQLSEAIVAWRSDTSPDRQSLQDTLKDVFKSNYSRIEAKRSAGHEAQREIVQRSGKQGGDIGTREKNEDKARHDRPTNQAPTDGKDNAAAAQGIVSQGDTSPAFEQKDRHRPNSEPSIKRRQEAEIRAHSRDAKKQVDDIIARHKANPHAAVEELNAASMNAINKGQLLKADVFSTASSMLSEELAGPGTSGPDVSTPIRPATSPPVIEQQENSGKRIGEAHERADKIIKEINERYRTPLIRPGREHDLKDAANRLAKDGDVLAAIIVLSHVPRSGPAGHTGGTGPAATTSDGGSAGPTENAKSDHVSNPDRLDPRFVASVEEWLRTAPLDDVVRVAGRMTSEFTVYLKEQAPDVYKLIEQRLTEAVQASPATNEPGQSNGFASSPVNPARAPDGTALRHAEKFGGPIDSGTRHINTDPPGDEGPTEDAQLSASEQQAVDHALQMVRAASELGLVESQIKRSRRALPSDRAREVFDAALKGGTDRVTGEPIQPINLEKQKEDEQALAKMQSGDLQSLDGAQSYPLGRRRTATVNQGEAKFISSAGQSKGLYTFGASVCLLMVATSKDPDGNVTKVGLAHIDIATPKSSISEFLDLATNGSDSVEITIVSGARTIALRAHDAIRDKGLDVNFSSIDLNAQRSDALVVDNTGRVFYGSRLDLMSFDTDALSRIAKRNRSDLPLEIDGSP